MQSTLGGTSVPPSGCARVFALSRRRVYREQKGRSVIEILSNFPDNVVACRASGRVTGRDYEDVLVPRVDAAMRLHPKVRCYYEVAPISPPAPSAS